MLHDTQWIEHRTLYTSKRKWEKEERQAKNEEENDKED